MIKNGYSKKLNVKYSEIDQNKALKPYSLLNFLQDIASENAEEWGFGYSFIHPRNYAWFLIKYRMEFTDYPFDVQDLTLVTEPRGYNKLFAFRDFEFYKDEKLIGRVASMWSLVDYESRAMVNIGTALGENPNMPLYEKRENDLSFSKITPISNPSLEMEFEVRYNDLDVNGHANNGNYIVWAFEPLSYEFKNEHKLKTLDMVYKKEVKFGEKLVSQIEFKDERTTIHRLKNSADEDLCLLECVWA